MHEALLTEMGLVGRGVRASANLTQSAIKIEPAVIYRFRRLNVCRRFRGRAPGLIPASDAQLSFNKLSVDNLSVDNLSATNLSVKGMLLWGLSHRHWRRLDAFEGIDRQHYYRRLVWVERAGQRQLAWVYLLHPRYFPRCYGQWQPEAFAKHLDYYRNCIVKKFIRHWRRRQPLKQRF